MILKIYRTPWTMLLGFETPLDGGEQLPITSYGFSIAWGFEIPNFLTNIPNFIKDVPKVVNDVAKFVKDVPRV